MPTTTILPPRSRVHEHYQSLELSSRLASADSHELVAILYEELLRALDVSVRAIEQGRSIATHPQTNRAHSILIALEASLDFKSGGTLSDALADVYRAMRNELATATRNGDAAKFKALCEGAASLAGAWAAIKT